MVAQFDNFFAYGLLQGILSGAILGVLGVAVFAGLTFLLMRRSTARAKRRAFAAAVRSEIKALREIVSEGHAGNTGIAATEAVKETENLLLLSPLFLPAHDAQKIVDFHEAVTRFAESFRTGHEIEHDFARRSGGVSSVLTVSKKRLESVRREVIQAAHASLAALQKY